jgi:hypothetical protein
VNEEALAHWGLMRQKKENKKSKKIHVRGCFSKPAKKVLETLVDTD